MKFRVLGFAALVACFAAVAHAQAPLRLQIAGGRVTLHAQNVPVRTILAEWARLGGVRIVNGDRVAGSPLTLDLEGVPERQALDIVLRGVSGYALAAREPGAANGPSMYDRIMILPTSVAPRNPSPTAAAPIFPGGPAGVVRPLPRGGEDQNGPDDGDVAQGNDGVPLARPVAIPRPIGGLPVGAPVMPPITVAPDGVQQQPQTRAPVVVTPSNPFGLPAGSSVRPGVITPAPQPQQQVPPRPGQN